MDPDSPPPLPPAAGTSAIGGHFLTIAFSVLPANLSLLQTAQVFAQISVALNDASVACWRVKQSVLFWRPITAIRYAIMASARTCHIDFLSLPTRAFLLLTGCEW